MSIATTTTTSSTLNKKLIILFAIVVCTVYVLFVSTKFTIGVIRRFNEKGSTPDLFAGERCVPRYRDDNVGSTSRVVLFDEQAIFYNDIDHTVVGNSDQFVSGRDCLQKPLTSCTIGAEGIADTCNLCIQASARCVHYDRPVSLHELTYDWDRPNKDPVLIVPRNTSKSEGYCTPLLSNATGNERTLEPCNPSTCIRYLAKPALDATGYMFVRRCTNDAIFTQRVPLDSDCDVPVSCESTGGKSVNYNMHAQFDISDVECDQCPLGTKFIIDPISRLPICTRKTFIELTSQEADSLLPKIPPGLATLDVDSHPAIDVRIKQLFEDSPNRSLLDPCAFDPLTGEVWSNMDLCELVSACVYDDDGDDTKSSLSKSPRVYYCKSNSLETVAVIQTESILTNNTNGAYPNACIRVVDKNQESAIPLEVIEYWNSSVNNNNNSKDDGGDDENRVGKKQSLAPPTTGTLVSASLNDGYDWQGKGTISRRLKIMINALINSSDVVNVFVDNPQTDVFTGKYGARKFTRMAKHSGDGGVGGEACALYALRNDGAGSSNDKIPAYPRLDTKSVQIVVVFYNFHYPTHHEGPFTRRGAAATTEYGYNGLPVIFLSGIGFLSDIMSGRSDNRKVDLLECKDIGRLANAPYERNLFFPGFSKIEMFGFKDLLYSCFVACRSPVDPTRLPVVPNIFQTPPSNPDPDYAFTTSVLAIDEQNVIYSTWLGNPDDVPSYLNSLPSKPEHNLW